MNHITTPRGESLKIIAPSQTPIGSPFTTTVIAFLPNGRTNWHYDGTLQVTTEDPSAKGIGQVQVIPVSGGAFKHTMTFATPGIHHISIRDTERGLEARSNPIHVRAASPEFNLYWGDSGLERLVEIYSAWGCGERSAREGNPYPIRPNDGGDRDGHHVKDALARGHTLGFTAGGDTHDAAPGGIGHTYNGLTGQFEKRRWAKASPHHPGLQGVWAEELTRESIFESIFNRRTYGTTGARIILKTELSSRPMGTVFPLRPNAPVTYKVNATGTAPIAKVEIVRNGETVHEVAPNEDRVEFTFEDTDPPTNQAYYYVRLTQQDGHIAWASPHYLPAKET
jgi:hypothetical protein